MSLLPDRFMDVPTYAAFFITAIVQVWAHNHPKCTLHILSALPYPNGPPPYDTDYSDGPDIVPAEYLAVEMINNRTDILKGYHLKLIEGHDGCGSTKATSMENLLLKNIFYAGKNVVGITGPRCYASAGAAGPITAKNGIALVNVHASSSSDLGNVQLYPYSFGATPSIDRFVDAYVALMKLNTWKHVGILFQDDSTSYSVLQSLNSKLSQLSGYEVAFSSIITDSYLPLDDLQASSARAILVIANSNLARMLMCVAYSKGAVFPLYQWTFAHRLPEEFIGTNLVYREKTYHCSQSDLLLALKDSIFINFSCKPNSSDYIKTGISGLTYPQYKQEYAKAVQRYNDGFYGPPVRIANTTLWGNPFHDAVWILALALNATDARLKDNNMTLCDYRFGQPSVTHIIQEEISRLHFMGVGGRIVYSNFNRFTPGVVTIWQVISNISQSLAYFDENNMLHVTNSNATFFHPSDEMYQMNLVLPFIFLLISAIALTLTAIFNVFNFAFRHHESVKASSHRLNHMAYAGVYLLSITIIMLTLTEGFKLPLSVKNVICSGVPWVSTIGFTAVYATVTVKLFRICKLLVIAVEKLQKPSDSKMMRDSILMAVIVALVLPDIVICTVWQCVDPIKITSYTAIQKGIAEPVYIRYESCFVHTSQSLLPWLLSLFIYNGILCCSATLIAFLTRSISDRNFKTGNILLISVLQLVLCGVSFPTLVILNIYTSKHADFILSVYIATCALLSSFIYLCLFLLFLPPLYLPLRCAVSHARKKIIPTHT